MLQIDIFSDPVCPWCYIGKRRLERALALRDIRDFRFRWRVFRLNPDLPARGIERRTYLKSRFGGVERSRQHFDNIRLVGKSEGIKFNFDRILQIPDTTNAHRLIRLAGDSNYGDAVVDALFRCHLVDGGSIGRIDALIDIAAGVGMDRDAVAAHLHSDDGTEDVHQHDRAARRLGVHGIPYFVVNKQYALSGAQEPEAFFPLFEMAGASLIDA